MEFHVSVQVLPGEDLSQIVEGYVEIIKLRMRKPISQKCIILGHIWYFLPIFLFLGAEAPLHLERLKCSLVT
jgi:hypothetical protein